MISAGGSQLRQWRRCGCNGCRNNALLRVQEVDWRRFSIAVFLVSRQSRSVVEDSSFDINGQDARWPHRRDACATAVLLEKRANADILNCESGVGCRNK